MSTITNETMTALAADLTSAVKDIRAARLAFRASIRAIREAGDWTATGLPATIEGAVRSGYRAAELVSTQLREAA